MEKFNKSKYDMDYRKNHKKQFNIDLNIDEYEELEELLKKHNLTKVNFVRKSMEILKEDSTKFIDEVKSDKELLYNGYIQSSHEYKGYLIWRTHSSQPFRIKKDGSIWDFKLKNDKGYNKISLNKIIELIDNDNLDEFYEKYIENDKLIK